MYTHVCLCVYTCISDMCIHVSIYVFTLQIYTYIIHIYIFVFSLSFCMYVCIQFCIYVCIYMYVCVYTHVCLICVYMCIYVYTRVYICVYITNLHTYNKYNTYLYFFFPLSLLARRYKSTQSVGSLKLYVSFAKEPYKRDDILQKRPILRYSAKDT